MILRRRKILNLFLAAVYYLQFNVIIGANTGSVSDVFLRSVDSSNSASTNAAQVEHALSILKAAGIDIDYVCANLPSIDLGTDVPWQSYNTQHDNHDGNIFGARRMHEETGEEKEWTYFGITINEEQMFYIVNCLMACICVLVAAMAAGLTMGLLSLDELDLHIKERASDNPAERGHAAAVMPIIRDHHRLLVTLLLLNAMANEALPLFLDELFPGYVAVIISVTLVLFFGEIIPSAIFSGSKKLALASQLSPLVRLCLILLAPIAVPIAKILDYLLHDAEDEHENLQKYNRNEIGALVRIQFEDRLAKKIKKKNKRARVGAKDNASQRSLELSSALSQEVKEFSMSLRNANSNPAPTQSHRYVKELDMVNIVEGALNMQSKVVQDVMTPLKDVYAIPNDMLLNEANVLEIYRRGHSRIPVYQRISDEDDNDIEVNGSNRKFNGSICGIFKVKQLIVQNYGEDRSISTMPLVSPTCVSPTMNMLELLNVLQTGLQMAIVCLHPHIGHDALKKGLPIPNNAGVIGVVTLEDCIEELIQEEIYDEFDKLEQLEHKRATKAFNKWREFVKKKKHERGDYDTSYDGSDDVCDESSGLISYGATSVSEQEIV